MKFYTKILLSLVTILIMVGLLLVFSSSRTYSSSKFNDSYYLVKMHIIRVVLALLSLSVVAVLPLNWLKERSKLILLITILALLVLSFIGEVKGASRWISFSLFTIQPSEIAKIILIVHLANIIETKGELLQDFKNGFIYPLFWVAITSGLVLIQPNVSTSIIILFTSFTILYVGGAKLKHILSTLSVGALIGGSAMMLFSHSRSRILTYIKSFTDGGDINLQVKQAKIGLGSGGWFGLGMGGSRQSDLFLPESYGDFVFSVLGEEYGFIGALLILIIYLSIFIVGFMIAKRITNKFEQMLVFGLSFNIVLNAFINAGVVTGIFPTTGITLPFISYGGTSLIFLCISVGIILNVARKNYNSYKLSTESLI